MVSLCAKYIMRLFDANIIGVTPDYMIKIREDVLREKGWTYAETRHSGTAEPEDHPFLPVKAFGQIVTGFLYAMQVQGAG